MSALVSQTVFERLPHLEDEIAYLFQAKIFARGDIVIDTPEPRRAYWQPFVLDSSETGKRFGKYTPGWPLMLASGISIGQTWIVNAFAAALTVTLVYRLGREIYDPDVGLIAAALTAFSPMALLLNASLMGHSAALFCATLFIYAYWRIEHRRYMIWFALVAGLCLGMLVIMRPLTAMSIALPFILWSGLRLLHALSSARHTLMQILTPLVILSIVTFAVSAAVPVFNDVATGDPAENLYTLVWEYDRIGFGECCGRNGHTLEKGIRHTRFDLSLTAADLFGWQLGTITPELQEHLRTESDYWPVIGLSFLLFPFGVVLGVLNGGSMRRVILSVLWAIGAVAWCIFPLALSESIIQDEAFSWLWIVIAYEWLMLPLLVFILRRELVQSRWTWMLVMIGLGIVLLQMTYWIGSQRYSTRYYFEALSAVALISAIPLAWLARHWSRRIVYGALGVLLLWSLYGYSTPRISALYGFNMVNSEILEEIEERRSGDTPVLVLIEAPSSGDDRMRWRAIGTLMAVTSPYLDSDIVVAWSYNDTVRNAIIERFPGREIIEMEARGNTSWFSPE